MLECRRVGKPLPGVPPGEEAHDGAMRIFGVINVLSDKRRLGNAFATRRKLLSGDEGEQPNHQPPNMPDPGKIKMKIICENVKYFHAFVIKNSFQANAYILHFTYICTYVCTNKSMPVQLICGK